LKPYGRGYSWFDIDARRAERVERAGLEHAADRVAALLARLTDVYPTSGRPVLTGFSQGGMIAFAVAVRHPTRIGVAIPLAGWLPVRLVPPGPPSAGAPPIYALHGADDPVLPLLPTMESVKGLRASGFTVDLEVYPATAHTVSPRMRRDLHRKIAEAVSLESAR
ncbi:MAG: dienelactone hydrolase family protein, partial [Myxococcota bacterium]